MKMKKALAPSTKPYLSNTGSRVSIQNTIYYIYRVGSNPASGNVFVFVFVFNSTIVIQTDSHGS